MTIQTLPIYFDYASTTPLDPLVLNCMQACLTLDGIFGNPASKHLFGDQAKAKTEQARSDIAKLINSTASNIIWTSGATESNNLAIKGVAQFYQEARNHIITSQTEHKSVLEPCLSLQQHGFEMTYLKPNKQGLIHIEELQKNLKENTILVSLMHVNNETGTIQNIEEIGKLLRKNNIFFHIDATQSMGKISIDVQKACIDLMSFSAHKIYGPKGIGALYINDDPKVRIASQIQGGGR